MIKLNSTNTQSGQVAIVILLIMVVLLTVGLSLASRTTQDLFLSQQESESARVFHAAEVGVEEALSQDFDFIAEQGFFDPLSPSTVSNVTTNTTIQPNSTLETQIAEGTAIHIDLDGYTNTSFTVDWARETDCATTASLLVSIYYTDNGTTKVVHEALGASDGGGVACDRSGDDEFTTVTATSNPYNQSTAVTIPYDAGNNIFPLFARVRAVYNDTALRVSGSGGFPTQFFVIRSEANTDQGEESRTVEVGRTLSGAPSFMDYAVYSGSVIRIEDPPPNP